MVSLLFSNQYLLPDIGKLWLKSVNACENMMVCNRMCKHFTYNHLFKHKQRSKHGLQASEPLQNYHEILPAPRWTATPEPLSCHSYLVPLASDEQQWKEWKYFKLSINNPPDTKLPTSLHSRENWDFAKLSLEQTAKKQEDLRRNPVFSWGRTENPKASKFMWKLLTGWLLGFPQGKKAWKSTVGYY